MTRLKIGLTALGVAFGLALAPAAMGQNVFRNVTTTANGYSTWDSDLINIEKVSQTGKGVYVAVLDTGMVPHWRDYFPEARVATHLGIGFHQALTFKAGNAGTCTTEVEVGALHTTGWTGALDQTHGTHVASTILGYFYRSNFDAAAGYALPPIMVRGIAPDVTVIPVKVISDYRVPAQPKCGMPGGSALLGTSEMIAAGINYVTGLKRAGYSPMVISMSLGGPELTPVEKAAVDDAIAAGVIVVVAAGNEGVLGMAYPGAYPPVISVGSVGWTQEWLPLEDDGSRYRMWWLQYPSSPLKPGSGDVAESTGAGDLYVSEWSSRALSGQELDVLAPGSVVRGPINFGAGYSHLPWWSDAITDVRTGRLVNFRFNAGTSMATPHVASVAALMLEKNPLLRQADVELIVKTKALPMPPTGLRSGVFDSFEFVDIAWDTYCAGNPCDAVGAGVIQADAALAATPTPP